MEVNQILLTAGLTNIQYERCAVFTNMLLKRRQRLKTDSGKRLRLDEAERVGVRLHSGVLREALSESNGETKKRLLELKVIWENPSYQPGLKSKAYWFTSGIDTTRRTKVKIRHEQLISNLTHWRSRKLLREIRRHGPTFERLLVDLTKISLSPRGKALFEMKISSDALTRGSLPRIYKRLVDGTGGWIGVMENGRLWSHLTCCPSELREHLCYESEPIVELDIPSSHPAILAATYSTQERDTEEFSTLIQLFQTRMFYPAFRAFWEIDPDGTGSEKVLIQKLINDRRPERNDLPIFRELLKEFPILMANIRRLKFTHRRSGGISNYLQGTEADLLSSVVTDLHGVGVPCFTCYDSIGVPQSKITQARSIFGQKIKTAFGFKLPLLTPGEKAMPRVAA